jgi:hypothetical protein
MDSANLKKIVPKSIKRPLKELVRRRQLRTAIKSIRKLPDGEVPSRELLSQLISGWGNDGYAANLDYLEEVAKRSLSCEGPILECGSGASTILLGILSARRQHAVWSLEHSPEWRMRVSEVLEKNGISGARVCSSPLIEYGEFAWYDPPLAEMPKEFSLVICDGPPGSTKGGRYGLLPVMDNRLPVGSTILLDDAGRSDESEIIRRWESEAPFVTQVVSAPGGTFAVMRRR